jgi:hypothetical protein
VCSRDLYRIIFQRGTLADSCTGLGQKYFSLEEIPREVAAVGEVLLYRVVTSDGQVARIKNSRTFRFVNDTD